MTRQLDLGLEIVPDEATDEDVEAAIEALEQQRGDA